MDGSRFDLALESGKREGEEDEEGCVAVDCIKKKRG